MRYSNSVSELLRKSWVVHRMDEQQDIQMINLCLLRKFRIWLDILLHEHQREEQERYINKINE